MAQLSLFVGVIGNIISVLMFLSPVPTFWRIVKRGSTEEFGSLPYICTLLNSSLWTYYGVMKAGEYLVATVNGFGVMVETAYLILFLVYAPTKMRAKTGILVGILDVGFFGVALIFTQIALHSEVRIDVVGIMGAALNILMYGSPLSALRLVVRTKSVEYMPFLLSLCMFLNAAVWLLYAILESDWILGVPNGSGFLLGATQLVVYAMYRSPKSAIKFNQDDNQPHDPLISSP
ncbi:hypothetical protein QN277_022272 [Acacia crassicarpa]|uniref:Bidirectional sugar transporter SWEET n=1 Tax=Acacia crassicarpa TaxID=499986 RepID=A0AAE1JEL7_9FABA|nr:hypothetical protein QN277_022272 [Acacia crassicarpa]